MHPKKAKIHVTFDVETVEFFASLANQEHKSIANLVKELALEALAMRDNKYLSKIAQEIDIQNAKNYYWEF